MSLSGSRTAAVTQTTTFTLSLTNAVGTKTYQRRFLCGRQQPAQPLLQSPSNAAIDQSTSPTFRWNPAADATSYQVQCAQEAAFGTPVFDVIADGATSYSGRGLLHGRVYYWRVRSRGPGGESGWSESWSFTTGAIQVTSLPVNLLGTPPEERLIEIHLQKPGVTDSAIMTMWAYDADASNEGEVSVNSSGPLRLFGSHAQSGNNQVVVPLTFVLSSGLFWNGANRLLFAHTRTGGFRIDSLRVGFRTTPVGSINAEPDTLGAGGGNITLSWTSNGATSISIAPSPGAVAAAGSAIVSVTQTTTFVLTAANPLGTATREVTVFVRAPRPQTPMLLSPSNASPGHPLALTFQWNASPGASSYRIQCSRDNSFGTLVMNAVTGPSPSYPATGLLHGRTYYWRVRARGAGGDSDWSETWSFATQPIAVTSLPVNLQGTPPEEQLIELQLQKPAETDSAFVVMWTYDAEGSNEGELTINGVAHLTLFGSRAEAGNNKTTVPIDFVLASDVFQNGANRLLYAHTQLTGFTVDSLTVRTFGRDGSR